jgi:hypothetical protein
MKRTTSLMRLFLAGLAILALSLILAPSQPVRAEAAPPPVPVSVTLPLTVVFQTPANGTVQLSGVPNICCVDVSIINDYTYAVSHILIGPPNSSGPFSITIPCCSDRTIQVYVQAYTSNGYADTHFFSVPTADTDIITIPVATLSNDKLQVQATSTNPNATLTAYWGSGGGTKLGKLTNNGNGNFSGQFHVNAADGVVTIKSLTHGCSEASVNRSTGWQYC